MKAWERELDALYKMGRAENRENKKYKVKYQKTQPEDKQAKDTYDDEKINRLERLLQPFLLKKVDWCSPKILDVWPNTPLYHAELEECDLKRLCDDGRVREKRLLKFVNSVTVNSNAVHSIREWRVWAQGQ